MIHHIQGNTITLTGDFSTEAMKIRRQWDYILEERKKCKLRLIYTAKLPFTSDGEIDSLKQKQRMCKLIL